MRFARHAGTLLPLGLMFSFLLALAAIADGKVTWERPTAYFVTAFFVGLGLKALLKVARRPFGQWPTVLVVSFIYQKIALDLWLVGSGLVSLDLLYPHITDFIGVPDLLGFFLILGALGGLIMMNLVLFFGERGGWWAEPTDPVPFRSVLQSIRKRRRRRDD